MYYKPILIYRSKIKQSIYNFWGTVPPASETHHWVYPDSLYIV